MLLLIFGPWTSAALRQEFAKLTQALMLNKAVNPGPMPLDLLDAQVNLQPGVIFDDKPIWRQFGDVHQDVNSHYVSGETVQVTFWGCQSKK